MSTFFNIDNHTCDCLAQQKVHAGEEFKIFYGPRNNADLFVHQGFVYPENQSDSLSIKLGECCDTVNASVCTRYIAPKYKIIFVINILTSKLAKINKVLSS